MGTFLFTCSHVRYVIISELDCNFMKAEKHCQLPYLCQKSQSPATKFWLKDLSRVHLCRKVLPQFGFQYSTPSGFSAFKLLTRNEQHYQHKILITASSRAVQMPIGQAIKSAVAIRSVTYIDMNIVSSLINKLWCTEIKFWFLSDYSGSAAEEYKYLCISSRS